MDAAITLLWLLAANTDNFWVSRKSKNLANSHFGNLKHLQNLGHFSLTAPCMYSIFYVLRKLYKRRLHPPSLYLSQMYCISSWFSGGLIYHPQTTKMLQPRFLPNNNKLKLWPRIFLETLRRCRVIFYWIIRVQQVSFIFVKSNIMKKEKIGIFFNLNVKMNWLD